MIYGGPPPKPADRRAPMAVIALAVALVASLAGNGILAVRLRSVEDEATTLRGRVEELQQELDERGSGARGGDPVKAVADAVERLRRLQFKKAVEPELLGRRALQERFLASFRKDFTRADARRDETFLRLLGLLGPDDDWYAMLTDLYREGVLGFYDDRTRRPVVLVENSRNPTAFERSSLAHELVHTLDDQHFDLDRSERLYDERKTDRSFAFSSFVEGEALLVQILYVQQVLTESERRQFLRDSQGLEHPRLDAAPAWVRRSFEFPYEEGLQFALAVYGRGGTGALDRVFADPPLSTEQIMHPGRYTGTRDDPVALGLPNVQRALGAGWKRLDESEIGELDVEILVDQFLPTSDASDAAAGWDGGRAILLESARGALLAALTAWDSEAEARQATESLGRWLPLRFGNEGSNLDVGGTGRGWQSEEGAGAVVRSGKRALFLIGPDVASVRRARGAFEGF